MAIKIKNRKAQLTLFIIIGLIIVFSAIAVILFVNRGGIRADAEENPKEYLEFCLVNELEKGEARLIDGNGYYNITDNYYLSYGQKIPFLCKSSQFYKPCANQEPNFIGHLQKEFEKAMNKSIVNCIQETKTILEKKGYSFNEINMTPNSSINFETASISINGMLTIKKENSERSFKGFSAMIKSPLYRFSEIARITVNYESALCEFNENSLNRAVKSITIEKFIGGDGIKVYTITDEDSQKKFKFAVRSCILPGGI